MASLRTGCSSDEPAIEIVVSDHRMESFHPDCFRAVGIDQFRPRALVVRSARHFRVEFAPIAREVLNVSVHAA